MNRHIRFCCQVGSIGWALIGYSLALSAQGAEEPAKPAPKEAPKSGKSDADTSVPAQPPVMFPTEQSIAAFEKRVAQYPDGLPNYLVLGQLYLRLAKEKDDFAAYLKAEAVLRKAVTLDPQNVGSTLLLAQALQAQHKFAEVATRMEQVLVKEPQNISAQAILADSRMELGQYEQAAAAYQPLFEKSTVPAVLARRARWAELHGDTQQGIGFLERALEESRKAGDPDSGRTWYHWRLGQMCFSAGQLDKAKQQYEAALKGDSEDTHAMAGLAAIHAAEKRYGEAIALYQKAIDIAPEPPVLAALGDLYTQRGEADKAKALYDRAETFMAAEAEAGGAAAHFREVARFYLDRDRQLPRALELAEKDLTVRPDIYSHDTLAWAYYKNGRYEDAAAAIAKAMKLKTQDASFYYHAGMIAHRLGQKEKAAEQLKKALAINPHFSLIQGEEARRTLAENSSARR